MNANHCSDGNPVEHCDICKFSLRFQTLQKLEFLFTKRIFSNLGGCSDDCIGSHCAPICYHECMD